MRTEYLSSRSFLVGVLGLAIGGFGCSDSGGDVTDGTAGGADASGGATALGTGGSVMTGGSEQSMTGGAPGSGGNMVQPAMGGTPGDGGTTAFGGAPGSGGLQGIGGAELGSGGDGIGGSGTGGEMTGSGGDGVGGEMPGSGGDGTGGEQPGSGGDGVGGEQPGSGGDGMGGEQPGSGGDGMGGDGMGGSAGAGTGGDEGTGGFTGTCTASEDTGRSASGSGPHQVVIETNSDPGISCGTIYRPTDLGGGELYPILVWGEGGCSQDGLSNQAAMAEIASHGYFIVADGTPGGTDSCEGGQDGAAFLDYITWAIAENDKPCSAYYQSLDTANIAADGFSCGGLMALNASGDPRFTAIGITSSGLFGSNAALYDAIHTPFKIMNGGPEDMAYENGLNDYDEISSRGIPIVYFAKLSAGHGGDLFQARGDFNLVNLAWLNWQLKGDEGETGKAFLHGATCEFCDDPDWEYMSANID